MRTLLSQIPLADLRGKLQLHQSLTLFRHTVKPPTPQLLAMRVQLNILQSLLKTSNFPSCFDWTSKIILLHLQPIFVSESKKSERKLSNNAYEPTDIHSISGRWDMMMIT